jgi:hypothetical protein
MRLTQLEPPTSPMVQRAPRHTTGRRIVAFAAQGSGGDDEMRLRQLLAEWNPDVLDFRRERRWRSSWRVLRELYRRKPDLVVMEGTGIGGGLAVLCARTAGVRYVISSGDAVAPFIGMKYGPLRPLFALYERLLCRFCAGFIGWTPYLCGRALTFGARRVMTAAGWAPFPRAGAAERETIRRRHGIPAGAIVFGLVGSLQWSRRRHYCYGYELVYALRRVNRSDVWVLIAGDGSGRSRLAAAAAGCDRIVLPGAIPRADVPAYLAAMDVASLPQSTDQLGSFRYSTKLAEYVAQSVPVATGQVPLAYDLDDGWMWRLPGDAPWNEQYIAALAALMGTITDADVAAHKGAIRSQMPVFARDQQIARVGAFLEDLLAD